MCISYNILWDNEPSDPTPLVTDCLCWISMLICPLTPFKNPSAPPQLYDQYETFINYFSFLSSKLHQILKLIVFLMTACQERMHSDMNRLWWDTYPHTWAPLNPTVRFPGRSIWHFLLVYSLHCRSQNIPSYRRYQLLNNWCVHSQEPKAWDMFELQREKNITSLSSTENLGSNSSPFRFSGTGQVLGCTLTTVVETDLQNRAGRRLRFSKF